LQPETERAALDRIVRVVRHDVLVFGLDAGEEFEDRSARLELIPDQRR
jgi:hypothetical protein